MDSRALQQKHYPPSEFQAFGQIVRTRIALAEGIFEVLPDRVQLDAQALDVGVGEMCKFFYICNRHYPAFLQSLTYASVTYVSVGYWRVKSRRPTRPVPTAVAQQSAEPRRQFRVRPLIQLPEANFQCFCSTLGASPWRTPGPPEGRITSW